MTPATIAIYHFVPGEILPEAAACLTGEERYRAASFHFSSDATHWSACRATLRCVLGTWLGLPPHLVPLILSPFGKPLLAPPFDSFHFNLSHSQGLALIAVSPSGAVGIDTEPLNRAPSLIGCESTFCHPEEIAALPTRKAARGEELLRIWTAKEAYVKALGTGLSTRLETIRIHTLPKGIFAASTDGGAPIMRLHHPAMGCFLTHLCSLQPVYAVNIMGVRETPTKAAGIG